MGSSNHHRVEAFWRRLALFQYLPQGINDPTGYVLRGWRLYRPKYLVSVNHNSVCVGSTNVDTDPFHTTSHFSL